MSSYTKIGRSQIVEKESEGEESLYTKINKKNILLLYI